MKPKQTITVVIFMMALVVIWQPLTTQIGKWMGYDMDALRRATTQPAATQPVEQLASSAPTTSSSPRVADATNPGNTLPSATTALPTTAPSGSTPTIAPAALLVVPATQPSPVSLGSSERSDKEFPLALNLVSQGAGLASVALNDFTETVKKKDAYVFQKPYAQDEAASRPLATRSVTVNGATLPIATAAWNLASSSREAATYTLDVTSPTGPVVRLVKTFEIFKRDRMDVGGGFDVRVTQRFENLSSAPIELAVTFNGPTTPPQELDRGSDRSIVGGYDSGNAVYIDHNFVEEFGAKQPAKNYTRSAKYDYPMLWAGASSVYFNAIVRPEPLDPKKNASPEYIDKVEATSLNPGAESMAHNVVLTFATKPLSIAAGESLTLPSTVFFGPKKRSLLAESYYALFPHAYNMTLVMTSGICGICTFQWLIDILVWMLNVFHIVLLRDWGLAIIALVFIVRLCLHPITKSSQKSMVKMGKMGPEMERLKKKYGDDKDALNKEMVKFYKEKGVTPILGCLPMFLQMPIWIALWSALQSTFELRHAPFLEFFGIHFTWIRDLAQPDHLIELAQPMTLFGFVPVSGLNILPFLLAGVFWLQHKYTPKPPTMTPEQAQQQKMMQWMTLLFPVMLYGGPSGLNLYILASTSFGIIESKIIRDHIKRDDEAAQGDRVIIDAPQTKTGKRHGSTGKRDEPEPKRGGIMGWIATLQEKADQVQKDAHRRGRG